MRKFILQISSIIIILLIQGFHSQSQSVMATWIGGSDQHGAQSIGELGVSSDIAWPGIPGGMLWGFKPNTWYDDSQQIYWMFQGSTNKLWKYDLLSGQWTWVKGTDVIVGDLGTEIGEPGVYGTMGVADPSNIPGARYNSLQWLDNQGNLYLYGGEGFDANGNIGGLSDLWKFEVSTNNWLWIGGPNVVGASSRVYGIKGTADNLNWPGQRMYSYTWIDQNGRFWLYSGNGASNDMWMFDPQNGMWSWMAGEQGNGHDTPFFGTKGEPKPENHPGNRFDGTNWIDSNNNLWLYGGSGPDANGDGFQWLNDLWKFNTSTLQWTWVGGSDTGAEFGIPGNYGTMGVSSPTNYPGSRNNASAWKGPNDKIWFFGGEGFGVESGLNSLGILNDLWWYDTETNQWAWMNGSNRLENGTSPTGNYGNQQECDLSNFPGGRGKAVGFVHQDDLYIFGGWGIGITYQGAGELNDLWRFSIVPTIEIKSILDITQTSFTVEWDSAAYAVSYELDISDDGFQSYLPGYEKKEVFTFHLDCDQLVAGTVYDVRIRANNSGCIGLDSEAHQQITVPETPMALDSYPGIFSFTARWEDSKGADAYYLDVSEDNFFTFLDNFENREVDSLNIKISELELGIEYQYRVRSYNSAGISPNSNVIKNVITGINDEFYAPRILLYPNPSIGFSTLETAEGLKSKFLIKDASGRVVFRGVTKGTKTDINLYHLRSGIYFLLVDGKVIKLMKQ